VRLRTSIAKRRCRSWRACKRFLNF
jgi:hypothetical protein